MPFFEKRSSKFIPSETFPFLELAVLLSVAFSSSLALTGLFPYIAYMVVDLHAADNVDEAGYVSGYISGAFLFGRMISSYFWGRFADRYGRVPVVYIGCLDVAVLSIVFGMSVNIYMAIISRLMLGLFNPLAGLTKTLVSEICGPKFEKKGMALTTGAWSLGLVVGPAIGGMLSRPCEQYPETFPPHSYPVLVTFPYLLPNLFSAAIALTSMVFVYMYFPETLFVEPSSGKDEDSDANVDASESEEESSLIGDNQIASDDKNCSKDSAGTATIRESAPSTTAWSLLSLPGVATYILAYFSVSFTAIIYDEVMPLWGLSSKEKGGADLDSKDIGQIMSIVGIPVLLFTFVGYPYLAATFGEPSCYRYGQLVACFFSLLTVFIRILNISSKYIVMFLIIFCSSLAHMCFVLSFTSLFLMINQSVSTANRASVNGLAMTIGSLAKAVGPMLGSVLYAWSINNGLDAPLNYMFVFVFCMMVGIGTFLMPVVRHVHDETTDYTSLVKSSDNEACHDIESGVEMRSHGDHLDTTSLMSQCRHIEKDIYRKRLLEYIDAGDSDSERSSREEDARIE